MIRIYYYTTDKSKVEIRPSLVKEYLAREYEDVDKAMEHLNREKEISLTFAKIVVEEIDKIQDLGNGKIRVLLNQDENGGLIIEDVFVMYNGLAYPIDKNRLTEAHWKEIWRGLGMI